jgi:AhpD family alkylhydroperoxidase
MTGFDKRFYTLGKFGRDFSSFIRHIPDLIDSVGSRRISHKFAEEIMMVVTQVNGCRYCSYVHSKSALMSGVSVQELLKLLALQTDDFPKEEAVALTFAQHYVESGCKPDPEVEKRFMDYYGLHASQDIMNYIRVIAMANLAGNTVDAFLSRLKGRPAKNSNPISEFILFLLFAPVTLPLIGKLRRIPAPASVHFRVTDRT